MSLTINHRKINTAMKMMADSAQKTTDCGSLLNGGGELLPYELTRNEREAWKIEGSRLLIGRLNGLSSD